MKLRSKDAELWYDNKEKEKMLNILEEDLIGRILGKCLLIISLEMPKG